MHGSDGKPAVKLLIVDDHPVVRAGLSGMLDKQPGIEVVGAAPSGESALSHLVKSPCDVVLLDLRMPGMNGIETLRAIRELTSRTKVIILSSFEFNEDIHKAVEAGAKGYLLKDSTCEEIVTAINSVHAGKLYFPERIAGQLSQRKLRGDISPRELEVLQLLAKGLTNKEIADILKISQFTVRNHVNHITEKLKVTDRTEAAIIAVQIGLIALEP